MIKKLHSSILKIPKLLPFTPQVGAELEFYVSGIPDPIELLEDEYPSITEERGPDQYEVLFGPTSDLVELSEEIKLTKNKISQICKANGGKAIFSSKPFALEYGSALHLHLTLHDESSKNVFSSEKNCEDNIPLMRSIAGLLDISSEAMYFLCKKPSDFKRYTTGYMAPVNASWSGNNRTTLIRIPDSPYYSRRIEFRLAGASCAPETALGILLVGVMHGFENALTPLPRVHGEAIMYDRPFLPRNALQAEQAFNEGGKIKSILLRI